MSIKDSADAIVAELRAAGIKATADPGEAASLMPCVLVGPPTLDFTTLCDAIVVTWPLVALAPKGKPIVWTEELWGLLEATNEALGVGSASPQTYALVDGQDPFPAYVMTYEE